MAPSRLLRRKRREVPDELDKLALTNRSMSFDLRERSCSEESANPQSDVKDSKENDDESEGGKASEGTTATASMTDSSLVSCIEPRTLKRTAGAQSASLSAIDQSSSPAINSSCEGSRSKSFSHAAEPLSCSASGSRKPLRSSLLVKTVDESIHSVGLSRHGRNHARFAADDLSKDGTASSAGLDKSADVSSLGVSFHSVEVREYGCQLGDNPSVSFGPPISIGWDYDESTHSILPVDEYEAMRGGERRKEKDLVIPRTTRENLVRESGYSRSAVASAVRQVEKDKRSRRRTVNNIKLMKFDESLESCGRKLKRVVQLGKKKDNIYDDWRLQKEMADRMIKEENEAAAALGADEDEIEIGQLAKAAILSPAEQHALLDTVSTKAKGTSTSILTRRWPSKAPPIVIEEDSTHRGKRHSRAKAA